MADSLLVIPLFISHRGCPHCCLFCNQYAITGDSACSLPDVGRTIRQWLARSPGRSRVQVAFYGGSFTCLRQEEQMRLLVEVQPFLKSGAVDSIRLSTRPDCVTAEIVQMLQDSGVATVELGVQSLDDRVLRLARRGHLAEESRRAIALLEEGGIKEIGVQLLPGLPGETTRSFLRGIKEVVGLRPTFVRLYPAVVVAGSGLAAMYHRGEYKPLTVHKAVALCRRAKEILAAANIPVIRIGLQPSAQLEKELVAGPFHPAFGELVASRQWYLRIRNRLMRLKSGEQLTIKISPRDYSAVAGMKKSSFARFGQLGFAERFQVVQDKKIVRGHIEYVVN